MRINEAVVCAEDIYPKSEIWEFKKDKNDKLTFVERKADRGSRDHYENYEGNA